jgi:hypothetical protein
MGLTVHFEVLNQLGTPLLYSATLANRPAAGIAGRIFFRTDSPFGIYRDTGTAWDLISQSGGGTITGSGAATQVAFWNSATGISGSNNLYWDSTNNYLGINTNTPGNSLDVHSPISAVAALNQTTATNNTLLSFLNSGTPLWRIGNFYTAADNDFGLFDVVNSIQQITVVKNTGQTFIGAKTTASGRLVINSSTADAHIQVVGANSPSIRIDNAGSGGTQRFVFGLATATNNFIQGSAAGQFCISTQSSGAMLFGMWQTVNASEVMRISTSNNLIVGSNTDNGNRLQVTGTSYFSSNVGIGISTSSWFTLRNVLQIGQAASISASANSIVTEYSSNAYINTSGNDIYFVNGFASRYRQNSGEHQWFSAPSGTGGNALTFTQTMGLTAAGNLGLGTGIPDVIGGFQSFTINGTNGGLISFQTAGVKKATIFNTSASLFIGGDAGISTIFNAGGSERARITTGGNFLIGTTTDTGNKLRVDGDISCSVDLRLTRTSASPAIITDQAAIRLVNQTAGDTITLNIQNNVIRFGGAIRTDTVLGNNPEYKLGRYNVTAPLPTGYLDIEVGGVVYKVLAST